MIKQRSNLTLPVSLYAIGNVKDELNLATGVCTRRIKKLVLTGDEIWGGTAKFRIGLSGQIGTIAPICTHYIGAITAAYAELADGRVTVNGGNGLTLAIWDRVNQSSLTAWTSYLATQYTAGTPVTVWYVLATPTTETVTVPEGLSGIVEGYLIQDGTPTPQNPIYPSSCDSVDIWNEVMYRQYGVNETLSPIPTTAFSQGDGIDSCTVYGNTVQNGTPTPSSIVDVNGVGENTISLGDYAIISNSYYLIISSGALYDMFQNLKTGSTYRLSWNYTSTGSGGVENSIRLRRSDGTVFKYIGGDDFTWSENDKNAFYDIITYFGTNNTSGSMSNFVCETEYRIQLNVDSQIANIYLGEVQSTRQIQKLVFDGTESIDLYEGKFYTKILDGNANRLAPYSSHYIGYSGPSANMPLNSVMQAAVRLWGETPIPAFIFYNEYTRTVDFKAYLQQQYAAGTPVTVYYVLAEPQATTLNEPLMKIGDYADSVTYDSNIPTTYGQNDITTDTQIKPSKLDITYNALRRAKVYKNDRWILNPSIDWSQTLKISDLQSKKIKEMEGEYIGYNIHT